MPPYIFTKKQIKKMIDTTYKVVSSL